MEGNRLARRGGTVASLVALGVLGLGFAPLASPSSGRVSPVALAAKAQTQPDDAAFQQVWYRTDSLVQFGQVKRSFYWGGQVQQPFYERYDDGPGGKHLVQYFEKSRMEINDPTADRSNPFYVTNGLLSTELITGRVQVGKNNFVQLAPAEVDLASDTSDTSPGTPTYASFRLLLHDNPNQVGAPVVTTVNRAGQVGSDQSYFDKYHVKYTYYEAATHNNIPDIFWDFLNLTGQVSVNGKITVGRLSDPYFYTTGYPTAAAHWATVTIAGVPDTAVLIQPYQRRVLTYVPSAPEGWRVQMGNVGSHYFDWRYGQSADLGYRPGWCQAPEGKIGALWLARPDLQQMIGCANGAGGEPGRSIALQPFEHGQMLAVAAFGDDTTFRFYYTAYALLPDGTALHDEILQSTQPGPQPPSGLYPPGPHFLTAWSDANMEATLGWATAPETVVTYDAGNQPQLPTPVPTALPGMPTPVPPPTLTPAPTPIPASNRGFPAVVAFYGQGAGGWIVYTGPALRKFYVLYGGALYNGLYNRWMAFDEGQ